MSQRPPRRVVLFQYKHNLHFISCSFLPHRLVAAVVVVAVVLHRRVNIWNPIMILQIAPYAAPSVCEWLILLMGKWRPASQLLSVVYECECERVKQSGIQMQSFERCAHWMLWQMHLDSRWQGDDCILFSGCKKLPSLASSPTFVSFSGCCSPCLS